MDYRGVLLVGVVLGMGVVASATACSAPDPGAISFSERPGGGTSDTASGKQGGTPGGTTSGGPTTDGGGTTEAGGTTSDPIFGTSTFAWEDPGVTANNANAAHNNTVEGKNCIQAGCHLGGAKPWAFGGTVYSAAQNGQTVPKAEVRIVKPDGTEYGHAYTDANGNFWLEMATPFPDGSKVGVRKEGGTSAGHMATLLKPDSNGCSATGTCHGGGTGKVWAP